MIKVRFAIRFLELEANREIGNIVVLSVDFVQDATRSNRSFNIQLGFAPVEMTVDISDDLPFGDLPCLRVLKSLPFHFVHSLSSSYNCQKGWHSSQNVEVAPNQVLCRSLATNRSRRRLGDRCMSSENTFIVLYTLCVT